MRKSGNSIKGVLFHVGLLILLTLGAAAPSYAHPVAQGSLMVEVSEDALILHARVSMEELVVETSSRKEGSTEPRDVWLKHGEYLLRHIMVSAGDEGLTGTLVPDTSSRDGLPRDGGFVPYSIRYALGVKDAPITISEDLLREIEYAPGNPWEATFAVSVHARGKAIVEARLLTATTPVTFSLAGGKESDGRASIALEFLRHGVRHILTGYDHLLFVSALALAVASFWELVAVISAFTLAHTVTLTLATLNIVRLPSSIVEPAIATSIVVVALQNVIFPRSSRGLNRCIVAFAFGLFHGLGFAGGLLDAMAAFPSSILWIALIAFSIGVEIGHQMVVLPLFLFLRAVRRQFPAHGGRVSLNIQRIGSTAIFCAGLFYLVAALNS